MRISKWALVLATLFLVVLCPLVAPAQQQAPAVRGGAQPNAAIMREVRHELVMLPWYSVFDNLGYSVNGYRVTLVGQVVRPSLKSDAEAAVKNIEGVESVDNQIEVLPLSPNDDQIRRAEYRHNSQASPRRPRQTTSAAAPRRRSRPPPSPHDCP